MTPFDPSLWAVYQRAVCCTGPYGAGLFAKTPLDASQFVLEYVGEVLPAAEYMGERMARYKREGRDWWIVLATS